MATAVTAVTVYSTVALTCPSITPLFDTPVLTSVAAVNIVGST
ncbi:MULTISPECIES: hypothetical protein [unclassified Frigoribacterium]|nr:MULTISPECIES: hypothetical protein [unclassified Frigoribacterium]